MAGGQKDKWLLLGEDHLRFIKELLSRPEIERACLSRHQLIDLCFPGGGRLRLPGIPPMIGSSAQQDIEVRGRFNIPAGDGEQTGFVVKALVDFVEKRSRFYEG